MWEIGCIAYQDDSITLRSESAIHKSPFFSTTTVAGFEMSRSPFYALYSASSLRGTLGTSLRSCERADVNAADVAIVNLVARLTFVG